MNIIKQLVISIGLLLVHQIFSMDAPSRNNQETVSEMQKDDATLLRTEINADALEAYRAALASPAVAGLTQIQNAKQYFKAKIVKKKQEIAEVKIAVNFDFLADPQISNDDKYNCLLDWRNKLEDESPLRIELMSLKLAYGYIKLELLKQTSAQIEREMQPYFPRFIRQ